MEELYRQYSQIVFYFLYTRCKISTWLCQIAKHLLYQHWEKSGREQFEETDNIMKAAANTESHAIARMELTDVWDKLQHLPPDMKKVVEFRVLGDFSYKEIGNILGKSENWARVTFYRAKMKLVKETGYGKDEL